MIRSVSANPYVSRTDTKLNIISATIDLIEESNQPKDKSDLLYILDLSALKNNDEKNTNMHDKSAAMLDLSQKARERFAGIMAPDVNGADNAETEDGVRPSDETGRLTRMLVAAKSTLEVQSVLADAFNHMREWQKLAAEGDKKAIAVVRRLNKLLSRGNRKVRELNKEQILLQRQKKAEEAEQKQIEQRLRDELDRAIRLRKKRERRYLQERTDDNEDEPAESGPDMAAIEAKIQALAAAKAALSSNHTNAGDSGLNDGIKMTEGSIANDDVFEGEVSISGDYDK